MAFIYVITNTKNGKKYVGQTINPVKQRVSCHLKDARGGSETLLHRAMRKYGESAFKFEVLAELQEHELDTAERDFIKKLDCCVLDGQEKGYNMTRGGEGFDSEQSTRIQRKRVEAGTHHLMGPAGSARATAHNIQRVRSGTHPFAGELGSALQRARIEAGVHPWAGQVGSERQKQKFADGTHHLIGLHAKLLAEGRHHSQITHTCPHCGKIGRSSAMRRWHFDNCKKVRNT